ncbi:MAG: Ig-like domain-containing protein [Flavonifractor plautii]
MTKNGPAAEPISFSEEDFVVEGSGKLDSIVIATLPDAAVGCLTLGAQGIQVGDVIAMEAVDGLRFTPLAAPAGLEAQFQFTPVFSDGRSGDAVTVELYLLAEANGAPVAENLEFTTYKNVAVTAQFSAVDPEGDLLTYHILNKPARGAVTMPEDGSSEFVYTPYENKTGKDSFTYVAVDAVGNSSDPATVKIKIEKPNTKVTYADMDGDPAIRLPSDWQRRDLRGRVHGWGLFLPARHRCDPGEFVAMAMNAAGMEALEDVERTGFADDVSIPTWAKPYVSSALKAGLVQGSRSSDGQVVFQAEEPITAAEAAVLLDRALQVTDVSADTLAEEGIPTWAAQSAANLATCGVLSLDGGLSAPLTRGEAAELLCGALELQDSRDGGWF